jgi:hypothetical protein
LSDLFAKESGEAAGDWWLPDLVDHFPGAELCTQAVRAVSTVTGALASEWVAEMNKTADEIEHSTPPWQLYNTDMWCAAAEPVIRNLVADGSLWSWPNPDGLTKTNFLSIIWNQLKKLNRETVIAPPECMGRARQVVTQGSETSALTYTLHVLLKVLPTLDTLDLKTTCADTLDTQLKSKNYALPAQIWEAVERAKKDGSIPIFDVAPVAETVVESDDGTLL